MTIADETGRQTGRTMRQMKDAPRGAVFVWCNAHLSYPRRLAKAIGRDDLLVVVPLSWLAPHNVYGRKCIRGAPITRASIL